MFYLLSGRNPYKKDQCGVYCLRHSTGMFYFGSDRNMRNAFNNWRSRLSLGLKASPPVPKRMAALDCAAEDWDISLLREYTNEPTDLPLAYVMWQHAQTYIKAMVQTDPEHVLNSYLAGPRGSVARVLKMHNIEHQRDLCSPKGAPLLNPEEDVALIAPDTAEGVTFAEYLSRSKKLSRVMWPTRRRVVELHQKWLDKHTKMPPYPETVSSS